MSWLQDREDSGKYILSQALGIKSPMSLGRSKEGSFFVVSSPKRGREMRHVISCDETAIYEVSKAHYAGVLRHDGGV